MPLLKKMLDQFGVEGDRVRLEWVAAAEADRFAHVINDMTAKVKALGPYAKKSGEGEAKHG
jgi:F420-non-reducing hydrogenase iron-sulfur subunit